jgi:hypothetical protein
VNPSAAGMRAARRRAARLFHLVHRRATARCAEAGVVRVLEDDDKATTSIYDLKSGQA